MTTCFGSRFVSLALVATFGALAACAPAPAKLLNPADERALKIMVAPPVPCSDLKIDLVNTYGGCENYGGMMEGDKFTKYDRPKDDSALMTAVDVRCYDLRPERIGSYAVCAPTVLVLAKIGGPTSPPTTPPETPAPSVATTSNTSGADPGTAATSATQSSDGSKAATADAGNTSTQSSSTQNPNGTQSVSAGGTRATRNADGSYSGVSFNN